MITMHATLTKASHHAITGGAISNQGSLPLKIVAITANLTKIARAAIDTVSAHLMATVALGLAPPNQECAILMSSITMNTRATRTGLAGPTPVRVTAKARSIPIHARNSAVRVKTEVRVDVISIVMLDRNAALNAILGSLAISIVRLLVHAVSTVAIGLLVTEHSLIPATHAGRVARQGNRANFRADLKNLLVTARTMSSSRAITSVLMLPTLLSILRVHLGSIQILAGRAKNAL